MKVQIKMTLLALTFFLLTPMAHAFEGDISISNNPLTLSAGEILEGQQIRIYASTTNSSSLDLLGVTRFYIDGAQIGADQAISIFSGRTDDIFIDWIPQTYGTHTLKAQIFPWEPEFDNPGNNTITKEIFVKRDTDHDGRPNDSDPDDDNDGVIDEEDAFPLSASEQYDTDGDGIGDNSDKDDDNDDVPDEFDDLPLDPNESMDTDKDGIGNTQDNDDDNDGLTDTEEENLKTDPILADSDEDGVSDKEDPFPLNPNEWIDTDSDNIGNNADTDDDNDGIIDAEDDFPLNKGPIVKLAETPSFMGIFEAEVFDASPSYDEDGEIVSYQWDIEGESYEGNSITHEFREEGEHAVKLTVIDNNGEQRSSEYMVSVLNLKLYRIFALLMFTILLAIFIYIKYISPTNKPQNEKINTP